MKFTDKIIENIAVLEYDIKELTDMIERYVSDEVNILEFRGNLYKCRKILMSKKTALIQKLTDIHKKQSDDFVDDYLQDYRDVLDYQNNDNLSDEDKQLFANDEAREEVQGRFTHQLNY